MYVYFAYFVSIMLFHLPKPTCAFYHFKRDKNRQTGNVSIDETVCKFLKIKEIVNVSKIYNKNKKIVLNKLSVIGQDIRKSEKLTVKSCWKSSGTTT